MKLSVTHLGFPPGAYEGIRDSIENWVQQQLEPLLVFQGEPRLLATVKRHAKGKGKYAVTLRMQLPRKHTLVAHGENADIHAALAQAEERLLREVKKYKDRLHNQADYRRKARRARMRALQLAQAGQPAEVVAQARDDIEPLLPQLERVVRRELAYLRDSGELPGDFPSVQDVMDEAVLAAIENWQPGDPAGAVLNRLLRGAFKTLDAETALRSRYGEPVSLEASPEQDAQEQAEAMVEEEIFEFYQPDDAVRLADVLADETSMLPEAGLDAAQHEYSQLVSRGLPIVWRRVWMLSEVERLEVSDIAAILEMELARVGHLLAQVQEFLREHLRQSGL